MGRGASSSKVAPKRVWIETFWNLKMVCSLGLFRSLVFIGGLGFWGATTVAVAQEAPITATTAPTAPRQKELITLVRQDCGSCHGLTLQGGLGPALLPSTLNGKPAEYLALVILQGRTNTAMPPWKRFLSEDEAHWIAVNLKRGFPDGH